MLDEPHEFDAQARAHAQSCADCTQQLNSLRDDAAVAAHYLSDAEPRIAKRRRIPIAYAAIAAAAAFVIALFTTPLGTYGQAFLTIFEPRQIQPIAIARSRFTGRR